MDWKSRLTELPGRQGIEDTRKRASRLRGKQMFEWTEIKERLKSTIII